MPSGYRCDIPPEHPLKAGQDRTHPQENKGQIGPKLQAVPRKLGHQARLTTKDVTDLKETSDISDQDRAGRYQRYQDLHGSRPNASWPIRVQEKQGRKCEWQLILDIEVGLVPSGGSRREPVSLPFPASAGRPHSLAPPATPG